MTAYNTAWSTSHVNRHMGVDTSEVQRIFFFCIYGKYEQTNMKFKNANLEFWNGLLD